MTLLDDIASRFEVLVPVGARCLLAVSGGPDSMALLDLLHLSADRHRRVLAVGHVDHGIHPDSARVARQVEGEALARGIPFTATRLELGAEVGETVARRARRRALRQLAREADAEWIVLAHHADDQVETILLRVLGGSGPAGLAGMVPKRRPWLRPLLQVRSVDLRNYVEERGITVWSDPANVDRRHLRSWIRHDVLPIIATRVPEVAARLIRLGEQAGEARRGWDAVPALLPGLDLRPETGGISVAAPSLQGYRSSVRHAVLAALGRQFGVPLGARRLHVLDRLISAGGGAGRIQLDQHLAAELACGRLALFRMRRRTIQAVGLAPGVDQVVGQARFAIRREQAREATRSGWHAAFQPGEYVARPWQAGDRIRPLGGRGSRAVAVLFREAGIAPHRRPEWPVVVDAASATIIWVPGICRSDARLPLVGSEAWHVECAFT